MVPLQNYVNQSRLFLRRLTLNPRIHGALRLGSYGLAGFCFSAASLSHCCLPLSMSLVCALNGWAAVSSAAGGCLGYLLFWGAAGRQGLFWVILGLGMTLGLSDRRISRDTPALIPATACLIVAAAGVVFQTFAADTTPVHIYTLRVCLGGGAVWLLRRFLEGRNPITDWLTCALGVLSLAQLVPFSGFSLGCVAAGALAVSAPFPAVALAGLALDLAQISPVPMTAVLTLAYLPRFLSSCPRALRCTASAWMYLLVMTLCGTWELMPALGFLLGGIAGGFLPKSPPAAYRRGETGAAQVRLEMAAGVMAQVEQTLLEFQTPPVDEDALVTRAAERACGGCPFRKSCKDARRISQLPGLILHRPLLSSEELPIICRKSNRFLAELHRSQEQLRSIRADRERQREYRAALTQQYQFLAEFLQSLSDQLSRRSEPQNSYTTQVLVFGNRPEADNGDRCMRFAGIGNRYYVLLCDGMGTGLGAVREGRQAASMLRRLLSAGFPPEHALRSLNSLCSLRERAGAVTVDLAELRLDSGKVTLYKWGAAPSYLLWEKSAQRLGAATPPPGLSVTDFREDTVSASLRQGQLLLLVSDGIAGEDTLRFLIDQAGTSADQLGRDLIDHSRLSGEDDATAAIIRLLPVR